MDYTLTVCVRVELLLKHKAVLQDVRHQTEGDAVSSALLLYQVGGSAAVCRATSSTMTGSVALLLVSSMHNRLTDVTIVHKHSDHSTAYSQPLTLCSRQQFL